MDTYSEVPARTTLLQGGSCDAWLAELADAMIASPSALDRVAALGLLARLWVPERRGEAAQQLQAVLQGQPDLLQAAVEAWATTLSAQTSDALEQLALGEVDTLGEQLESAHHALSRAAPNATELVRALVHQRDDLASIEYVLHVAGHGELLREALHRFDEDARVSLTTLSMADGVGDDDRLVAIAFADPAAWWGALAES